MSLSPQKYNYVLSFMTLLFYASCINLHKTSVCRKAEQTSRTFLGKKSNHFFFLIKGYKTCSIFVVWTVKVLHISLVWHKINFNCFYTLIRVENREMLSECPRALKLACKVLFSHHLVIFLLSFSLSSSTPNAIFVALRKDLQKI